MVAVLGCKDLAKKLSLPEIGSEESFEKFDLILEKQEGVLSLFEPDNPKAKVFVDFSAQYDVLKKTAGLSRNSLLGKAVAAQVNEERSLVDMTAGLGGDALVFAALGFHVVAMEQSKIVFELLLNGIERGLENPELKPILERLEIQQGDSSALNKEFDIAYIDPMYPEKKKKSLPKKEMQVLQKLLGPAGDVARLLKTASEITRERIVVKRPLSAGPVSENVTASFSGKSVRFDMYRLNNK